jgi:hypothetical protein
MLRKILPFCVLLGCMVGHAQAFKQITLSWTNPNSPANGWPNCAFTATPPVATICVQGFTLTDITTPTAPVVLQPTCLGPASTSFVIAPLPSVGSHTYSLVTNGLGSTGAANNSAPSTVTVSVPAPSPSGPSSIIAIFQ